MAENVNVNITGNAAGAVAAMKQASAAVSTGVSEMKSAVASLNEAFATFAALGIATIIGHELKNAIMDTAKEAANFTRENVDMARKLGISADEAVGLTLALEEVGASGETFTGAAMKMDRQLKSNEGTMNQWGLVTRDANGHLKNQKELVLDAIKVVNSYKDGIDRNQAAQTFFGRGAASTTAMLKLTEQNMESGRQTADAFGLTVGTDNVQAMMRWTKASAELDAAVLGVKVKIGNEMLPVATDLSKWLAEVAPGAIRITVIALNALATVGHAVAEVLRVILDVGRNVAGSLVDLFIGVVRTLGALLDGISNAIDLAMHRDFKGAWQALKDGASTAADNATVAWDAFGQNYTDMVAGLKADTENAASLIADNWAEKPNDPVMPTKDNKRNAPTVVSAGDQFAEMKLALQNMKLAGDYYRRTDLQADLDYWSAKLKVQEKKTVEGAAIARSISGEIMALREKMAAQDHQLDEEAVASTQAMASAELDIEEQAMNAEIARGLTTDRQEIAMRTAMEAKRFALEKAGLAKRLALAGADKVARQKLMDELELSEKKHALATAKINEQITAKRDQMFQSMRTGFTSVLSEFFKGAKSIGDTIRGLMGAVLDSVTNMLADMLAQQIAVVAKSLLLHKGAALKQIGHDAAKAGSGAYQAVVGIPYVGPFLAPAAAAAAFAATLAFGSGMSAAGGYDVPAGVNPMTQLHQKEMVLPEKYADVIRGMEGGSRGAATVVHLPAMSMGDAFMVNRDALKKAITAIARDGGVRFA